MTSNTHQLGGSTEHIGTLVERLGIDSPTVLGVWAHPDDESVLAGGLLAEIARRGGRAVTVTATAGEHGTHDPVAHPPAALAERRIRELDAALAALGAEPAIHLGYGDGACDLVTDRLAAHLLGRIMERVDPDVVVTFGPDGVTGHPDHCAVGRWTRLAVADRGDRTPLLTTAAASAWSDDTIERLHTIDAFWPGHPILPDLSEPSAHVAVHLDDDLIARKLDAIGCHASQMGPVAEALGTHRLHRLAAVECYAAGNPTADRCLSNELARLAA